MMSFPNHAKTRPGTTRRVRLADYDYSTVGYSFITICTHNRHHYFGSIHADEIHPSPASVMVDETITECGTVISTVTVDSYLVMPNHIHILLGLSVRLEDEKHEQNLTDVVHWLKSTIHQRYRSKVRYSGWKPYDQRVWQEGYHDHIVRNDRELETLRTYIATNVENWEKDRFYDGF